MRKASIVILCIALCTTLIVPVSAKMSEVTLTGPVTWSGYANVRNTKNCIEIKAYEKKPLPTPIVFTDVWPGSLAGDISYTIELSIYINKKNNVVKMNYAWGEYNPSIAQYILKARGNAVFDPVNQVIEITLTQIETWERVKPNEFILDGIGTSSIVFWLEL